MNDWRVAAPSIGQGQAWLADGVLELAYVHLLATLVESVRLRENLPWSMVTGRRRSEDP